MGLFALVGQAFPAVGQGGAVGIQFDDAAVDAALDDVDENTVFVGEGIVQGNGVGVVGVAAGLDEVFR